MRRSTAFLIITLYFVACLFLYEAVEQLGVAFGFAGLVAVLWANALERETQRKDPPLPMACIHGHRRRVGNVIPIESHTPCSRCAAAGQDRCHVAMHT